MEWLKRHDQKDNLTSQNIKFNFSNEMLSSIAKVVKAIYEKRRVAFDYLNEYRKVKPQGLKYFNNKWYLAGEENIKIKTFNLIEVK